MSVRPVGRWRALFVVTILTGSFLLFLVQPLVARMALPRLGGAPAVWNSAMLVYQALLLAGYAYAHLLSRLSIARQATIHLVLMALAALTLPIALADLPPPAAGWEALWVPALLFVTVGPLFFLVAAQAPMMQRWYAAHGQAGDPYWLYAASNLGSFAGLIAYPLLLEPGLPLAEQSWAWAAGYALLFALVGLAAFSRRGVHTQANDPALSQSRGGLGWGRIALWLGLSAVPSGLMLSTTTHLTTDIVAMPLLWVVPLGLYLLSFTFAFNPRSHLAHALARSAPIVILLAGSMAMVSHADSMSVAIAAVAMLFVVSVALHRRLYATRPEPSRLTAFYLAMSAGGALGGLFAALVAPLLFDWVWEHPLLILAGAALLPSRPLVPVLERFDARGQRLARLVMVAVAAGLGVLLTQAIDARDDAMVLVFTVAISFVGILALGARWAFVAILLLLMLARGGYDTLETSLQGDRSRSYFGVYTVEDVPADRSRQLLHGTTLHGKQSQEPGLRREPTTYYGRTSGVGLVLQAAPFIYGNQARVGIVGLGVGTLACYRQPGQRWTFFEIDPNVLAYSRAGRFTFLSRCAPDAAVRLGDARLKLADEPANSFDVLAIDAFSSDAIPLHLMTREAFDTYARALSADGIAVVHISNRYIDLRPVLAAHAQERGWVTLMRDDPAAIDGRTTSSLWVAMARNPESLARVLQASPDTGWRELGEPAPQVWTDDHASILPFLVWANVLGRGV